MAGFREFLPHAMFSVAAYGMGLAAVAWHLQSWPPARLFAIFVALAIAHARWMVEFSAHGDE